ncbi:MAG TPA: hypothetical protein VD772_02820, partial [Anseongella sp.]|nr:hypothetical protein [Anseongella sp.]
MDLSLVFNTVSAWWAIFCVLLGVGYAWWLYRKDELPGKSLRRLLFAFRTAAVALLAFLLLSPLLKSVSRTVEKPLIVIAQDNSSSILLDEKNRDWYRDELPAALRSLQEKLQDNYDVQPYHFSNRPETGIPADFTGKETDMSLLMQEIKTRFAGRNLGAVILLSDGIYNKGSNPLYAMRGISAPFYTVALGDTIPKRDLLVSSVDHNQVVFLGNDFRISVNAEATGFRGSASLLRVSRKGETV